MRKYKKRSAENGFTLIEVMVAVVILFIITLAFTMLFSQSYTHIYAAGNKSEAQYVLQDATENELSAIDKDLSELGVVREVFNVSGFEIHFDGIDNVIVDGNRVTLESVFADGRGSDQTMMITVFIPSGSE